MSTTPMNPAFPPDPNRDPDLTEPDITTPPGDDSPLIEPEPEPDPDVDPNEQLPKDV